MNAKRASRAGRAGARKTSRPKQRTALPRPRLALRLYVAGTSPRSLRAIQNARAICDEHFRDRHILEVIDIFQQPWLAKADQILAVPTLIRCAPAPLRRFIGDLSDRDRVVAGLDGRARAL